MYLSVEYNHIYLYLCSKDPVERHLLLFKIEDLQEYKHWEIICATEEIHLSII